MLLINIIFFSGNHQQNHPLKKPLNGYKGKSLLECEKCFLVACHHETKASRNENCSPYHLSERSSVLKGT